MLEALKGERDLADIFAEAYAIGLTRRWERGARPSRNVVAAAAPTAGKSAGTLTRGRGVPPNLSPNPGRR